MSKPRKCYTKGPLGAGPRVCEALTSKETERIAEQKEEDDKLREEVKALKKKGIMGMFGSRELGKNYEEKNEKWEKKAEKKKAAEKAKSKEMIDLWNERKDLVGLGGEGQSCLTKEIKFMGTPGCPVGQTCSSEGDQKGTCAPNWENQRYSFGMWKGTMLTSAERTDGEYQFELHKGCITANECRSKIKLGKSRSSKTRSFYAAADPNTLPNDPNWWRSNELLYDAVTEKHKPPGWIARGGNIIAFKTSPSSSSHKLMPGQFCGDKNTCKKWCVDATSFGMVDEIKKLMPGLFPPYFCWEIKKPMKCRPDMLPDCRGKLQCMDDANGIATCENPTGDKGKRLIALKEKKTGQNSTASFEEDAKVCVSNCRSEQPCTGSNGNGIQKRTVFTQSAVGSDGTPSGPAGPAAGEFRTIPTPLNDVSVFATGQCFECLLGADNLHFRCPVHGRRMRLVDRSGALRGFAGMKALENNPQHLDEALHLALYAAPDACFNHNPEKLGEPKGPFRMLRDKNYKVSLSFDLQVYYKCYQPLVSRACQAVTPPHT